MDVAPIFNHMTESSTSTPADSQPKSEKPVTPAKKVSSPRPKKVAKVKDPVESELPVSAPLETSIEPKTEWPEPEDASFGGNQSQTDSVKRKRRRRKGKGASNAPPQNQMDSFQDDSPSPTPAEPAPDLRVRPPAPVPQSQMPSRPKVDPALLTKMAWKIFLAEVSEEGVALIGDSDAKDLTRRCFRLAEIFIEEQSRRR
jgi:hypothetical protein